MAAELGRPAAGEVDPRERELAARAVPGQCRSEPHPAATPGPAALVNKARASRTLAALLVGFSREFPSGLEGAAEPNSGRADWNTSRVWAREARGSGGGRAQGARSTPVHSRERPGTERWRGAREPLGTPREAEIG